MEIQLGIKTVAGTFDYYQDDSTRPVVDHSRPIDINGDGVDEVLFFGHETQPNTSVDYSNTNLALFGWVDGKFVNITQTWLPGTAYQVGGVNDVATGDFNGDGRLDIFLAAYTDMNHAVGVYVLMNMGTHFDKVQIGTEPWQHGADAVDFNRDGYMDVMTSGYGKSPKLYLGSPTGLKFYQNSWGNGSDIVFGDFLNDGSLTAVLTDQGRQPNNDDVVLNRFITDGLGDLGVVQISRLPVPIFETRPYDIPGTNSHDVRALPVDFNSDGLLDIVVLSTVMDAGDIKFDGRYLADLAEVQFLRNDGRGQFTDVTSTVRVGHDDVFHPTYSPLARDFNGDGLVDIWANRLYLQNSQGQFVATGNELFKSAVIDQATLARGPDGAFYLVTSEDDQGFATVSIAKVTFGDKTVDIADDSSEAQIIRLYDAAFDRQPDQEGFDFWVEQLDNGTPLIDVGGKFIDSAEFSNLYGTNSSNDTFVTALYNNVLDRTPDSGGLAWWTNNMDLGMSRSTVLLGFSESIEYIDLMQLQVDLVATSLGVSPDGGG
jgi:hypothetical protein